MPFKNHSQQSPETISQRSETKRAVKSLYFYTVSPAILRFNNLFVPLVPQWGKGSDLQPCSRHSWTTDLVSGSTWERSWRSRLLPQELALGLVPQVPAPSQHVLLGISPGYPPSQHPQLGYHWGILLPSTCSWGYPPSQHPLLGYHRGVLLPNTCSWAITRVSSSPDSVGVPAVCRDISPPSSPPLRPSETTLAASSALKPGNIAVTSLHQRGF